VTDKADTSISSEMALILKFLSKVQDKIDVKTPVLAECGHGLRHTPPKPL